MTLSTKRRSGFVLRLLSLVTLGLALLFSALVIIDNSEIQKVIPPTPFRSLALFFGYTVAIMSFNYLSALKGGNFMGWRVELAVVTIAVLLFAASFLPFAFPIETRLEAGRFGGLFGKTQTQSNPDWRYSWIALVAAPLAMYVILRLRKMPLWQKTMQQGGIFKVEARSDQEPNH